MRLLDRYIARQFLTNVLLLLACLLTITVLIDFALNFDEFLESAAALAGRDLPEGTKADLGSVAGMTVWLVWDFWWPQLLQLTNYLLGLVTIGAMGFTCAQLVKHREFVAVLAGGISLHRLAAPVVVTAIGLTLLQVVNREWIVPDLAPLLTRNKQQLGKQTMGSTAQPLCADAKGRIFYARNVDLDTGDITGLWVWERDEAGLMTRRIRADSARWENGAWQLKGGLADDVRSFASRTTVAPPTPVERIETDLDPTVLRLRRFEGYSGNLSTAQLTELITRYRAEPGNNPARTDRLDRLRWGRISLLLANLLTLLICLPFFLRREPCNMVLQTLYAAPVAIGAMLVSVVGATTAIPGLPPAVGVFVPVMVLIPLAIAAVTSVKT